MDAEAVVGSAGVPTGPLARSPLGLLVCWLVLINLAAFLLMGDDKRRARRKGVRRIPEQVLFLAALLGGSPGAILGMWIFRHKTKHWYFVWGMPAILAAQLMLAAWVVRASPPL